MTEVLGIFEATCCHLANSTDIHTNTICKSAATFYHNTAQP